MKMTILGATGFIGSNLIRTLSKKGYEVWAPGRNTPDLFKQPLGCVYYCIGLTADFRQRPYDTIDAHVCLLRQVLEHAQFDNLIYLSSTRVYAGCEHAEESQPLIVRPEQPDYLYNISKLMGENLTLNAGRNGRVARLSNVIGPDMGTDNFVGAVLDEAQRTGTVRLHTSLNSSKDYIWIDDAIEALAALSTPDAAHITNIAGGQNTTHAELSSWLRKHGFDVNVDTDAPTTSFPPISISRLRAQLGRTPAPALQRLDSWYETYRLTAS